MWFLYLLVFQVLLSIFSALLTETDGRKPFSDSAEKLLQNQGKIAHLRESVRNITVHDWELSDNYLLRFLQASDMDVDLANKSFHQTQQWRKDNSQDTITSEVIPIPNGPLCSLQGFDYEGGPILTYSYGIVDFRRIVMAGHGQRLVRSTDQCNEWYTLACVEAAKNQSLGIVAGIVIVDATGYTTKQYACYGCLAVFRQLLEHRQYFPMSEKAVVVINTPSSGRSFIELMRPLFPPQYKDTIKFFGVNEVEWSEYLDKLRPPSNFGRRVPLSNKEDKDFIAE